jgi:hypothetical protein
MSVEAVVAKSEVSCREQNNAEVTIQQNVRKLVHSLNNSSLADIKILRPTDQKFENLLSISYKIRHSYHFS